MEQLPELYKKVGKKYPDVTKAHDELSRTCHEAGPLDERTRRLVKIAIAVGQRSEGAVHAQTRMALEDGIGAEEIRHVVLLAVSSVGFPNAMAAMSWVDDIAGGS